MYFTILEKTPLNPVYLKSLGLMNSSQQASNFRWSVFCHSKPNSFLSSLTMGVFFLSVFSTMFYSLLLICRKFNHTTQTQRLRTHWELMTSEEKGPPSPVSGLHVYIGVQGLSKLVLPKYLRVFSSNNSFRVYIYPRILASSSAQGGRTVVDWWWRWPTRGLGLARGASCWWRVMAVCCRSRQS